MMNLFISSEIAQAVNTTAENFSDKLRPYFIILGIVFVAAALFALFRNFSRK